MCRYSMSSRVIVAMCNLAAFSVIKTIRVVREDAECESPLWPTLPPSKKGSKEATFTALAKDFGFNDKVRHLFLSGQRENLEDLRYYFPEEKRDRCVRGG